VCRESVPRASPVSTCTTQAATYGQCRVNAVGESAGQPENFFDPRHTSKSGHWSVLIGAITDKLVELAIAPMIKII
jgi:hypothetical protein